MPLILQLLIIVIFTLKSQAEQDAVMLHPIAGETETINYSPDLEKQANAGDVNAQYKVGLCYRLGLHVKHDNKEAVRWFKMAAEMGHAKAQRRLADAYSSGLVLRDEKEACKWYAKAAEQGDADSQNMLGFYYLNGRAFPKDEKEALKWFKMAAAQMDIIGQVNVGDFYRKGIVVQKDEKEAVKWYVKATEPRDGESREDAIMNEQSYGAAYCSLGECYENGIGVTKDENKALECYTKAVELRWHPAKPLLVKLESRINK